MSEPIKVGDLVMVIRPKDCGCPTETLGMIYIVASIKDCDGTVMGCNHSSIIAPLYRGAGNYPRVFGHRLKRIPPLCELEGEKRDEEISA